MKKYIIFALIILSLLGSISVLWNMYNKEKKERQRQESNVEVLNSTIERATVRDSLNVASISALTYNVDELKKYRAADLKTIEDLKIKKKDVESITNLSVATADTLTKKDFIPLPDKPDCLHFKNRWADITACFKDSTISYATNDSISLDIAKVPKRKFLWWSWGTKGYNVHVLNYNPKSHIKYLEYIRVK